MKIYEIEGPKSPEQLRLDQLKASSKRASHPQRKVQYPHRLDRWPPAGLHHCPAPSQCSGPPTQVVLAKLICMACSSRLRVQGNPIRHKNPSNGSKPWIYGKKYSVFKFLDHGDERHSENGLRPIFRLSNLFDEVKFMQCF